LNVKKSILALEDAIAYKDEAAIVAATKKLNADLGVLNALTGQNTQMKAIETILNGLKPKDLINQANLDEALRKIKELLSLMAGMGATGGAAGAAALTGKIPKNTDYGSGITPGDYVAPVSMADALAASTDALLEYADAAGARADAFALLTEQKNYADFLDLIDYQKTIGDLGGYSSDMNRGGSGNTIIVNTGIGDPNAIAEAIDQVLIDAVQRGTLRGGVYSA